MGVAWWAPTPWVWFPGAVTGIAAVLIDYVWTYRAGKREILVDGKAPTQRFLNWWLIGWFEFLIAFNMGVYLVAGLTTPAGIVLTIAFELWFWVLAPVGSRLLHDLGIGRQMVWTVHHVGEGLSWGRAAMSLIGHGLVLVFLLDGDLGRSAQLFAIGVLCASGMEVPLYMLGIRPGEDAWKSFVMNSLFEWNYAVPIMFSVFVAAGVLS